MSQIANIDVCRTALLNENGLLLFMGLSLGLCSCRNPAPAHTYIDVPPNEMASGHGDATTYIGSSEAVLRYIVMGEVKKPGYFPCSGTAPMRSSKLISEAGGLTDFARYRRLQVIHAGVTKIYNYRLIRQGRAEDP